MIKSEVETFHHTQNSYPVIPKLRELENIGNFVGQTQEQRRDLEDKIKARYVIEDCKTEQGIGYKIHDIKKDSYIFFNPNSRLTLETRYLEKGENRVVTENALDLFARVASNIAEANLKYNKEEVK